MEGKLLEFPPRPSRAVAVAERPAEHPEVREIREQAILEAKSRAQEHMAEILGARGRLKPGTPLSLEEQWDILRGAAEITYKATQELIQDGMDFLASLRSTDKAPGT